MKRTREVACMLGPVLLLALLAVAHAAMQVHDEIERKFGGVMKDFYVDVAHEPIRIIRMRSANPASYNGSLSEITSYRIFGWECFFEKETYHDNAFPYLYRVKVVATANWTQWQSNPNGYYWLYREIKKKYTNYSNVCEGDDPDCETS